MAIRIQVRRGTATQWSTSDPVLAAGEIGFETNTGKFKVGVGGTTVYSDLPYFLDEDDIASLISSSALSTTDDLTEGSANKYLTAAELGTIINRGTLNNITFTYNAAVQGIDVSVPTVQGTTGAQGTQGVQGVQGVQGTQGVQGIQGVQGVQGVQGTQGVQGSEGTQGVQGVQGLEGFVGSNGAQGTQGTDGTQGVQGTQGTQGVQGTLGAQGVQGTTGTQGTQGLEGSFGGVTFDYSYDSDTTATDPANKYLKFNAALASATILRIDDNNFDNTDIHNYLQTIDDSTSTIKGHVKVSKKTDNTIFALYTIDSLVDQANHFDITVAYVAGNGTLTNNDRVLITFARTGDVGAQGTQGTLGAQGTQGTDGTQGVQGTQGTQGVQGTVGAQGTQGVQGTTGAQGTQGTAGIQGTQGIGGTNGAQGTQGTQGQVAADPTTTVLLFGGM